MDEQVEELAKQGKQLPAGDRSRLVDMLLESLHEASIAEGQAAGDVEVEDRLAAYHRGELLSTDGEEVLAKAHRLAHR